MGRYKHADGAGGEIRYADPRTGEDITNHADANGIIDVSDEFIDAVIFAPYADTPGHPLTTVKKKKGAN